MIEVANWKTTNPLRRNLFPLPTEKFPFKTTAGLNDERTKAGKLPASIPVISMIKITTEIVKGFVK